MKKRGFVIAAIVLICLAAFVLIRYYRPPIADNTALEKSEKDFTVAIGAGLAESADSKSSPLHRIDTPIRLKIIDINNIIGIVTLPDALFIAALSIAFILGIYLGIYVIKARMGKPKIYSSYEIAVKSLTEINPEKACSETALRELYFKVSYIIREYLKRGLNFGKAELTTKEFLVKLDGVSVITDNSKNAVKNLIMGCDLVKFSGKTVNIEEFKVYFDAAKKIIDEIGDNK